MNDEIREIIDYFKRNDKNKFGFNQAKILNDNQAKLLLDYITNLQKENERLKEDKKKAVEYINKNKHLSMFADCRESEEDWNYDLECSANDLLNILQGEE